MLGLRLQKSFPIKINRDHDSPSKACVRRYFLFFFHTPKIHSSLLVLRKCHFRSRGLRVRIELRFSFEKITVFHLSNGGTDRIVFVIFHRFPSLFDIVPLFLQTQRLWTRSTEAFKSSIGKQRHSTISSQSKQRIRHRIIEPERKPNGRVDIESVF